MTPLVRNVAVLALAVIGGVLGGLSLIDPPVPPDVGPEVVARGMPTSAVVTTEPPASMGSELKRRLAAERVAYRPEPLPAPYPYRCKVRTDLSGDASEVCRRLLAVSTPALATPETPSTAKPPGAAGPEPTATSPSAAGPG